MTTPDKRILGLSLLLAAALAAVYSNHFQNSFHFDDWHTITGNPWIRTLGNVPRFFTDSRTMSVLPASQSYRPLLTASLALDYRLGHGANPVYFHASTFFWYVVLLAAMFFLFESILRKIQPAERNAYLALFATGWFGLHPAMAETVNYIIQRADLYVALGVVAGMALYIRFPGTRKWWLYLIPVALAGLAKLTAVMFAPILAVYIYLFETEDAPEVAVPGKSQPAPSWKTGRAWAALRGAAPAFLLAAGNCLLTNVMTQKTFNAGGVSLYRYLITQPRVTLHYFFSFFLPAGLTADTDRQAFESLWNEDALLGVVFLAALVVAAVCLSRRRQWRPIAFGLWWFLLALVPTAAMPLAEVENDHRMFAPFVGLALSATWAAALLWDRYAGRLKAPAAAALAVCLLAAYGAGAYERNKVWRTEETLWLDVVRKSPRNGRGLMNYGLTQMSKGDYRTALDYYTRALSYTPNYALLEVNLGLALTGLQRGPEAEIHFRRAVDLEPRDALVKFFYARWLKEQGRIPDSMRYLREALTDDPLNHDARALLLVEYAQAGNWGEVKGLAEETQRLFPGDALAADLLSQEKSHRNAVAAAETKARQSPSPENFLELSLLYSQAGRFADSIAAAKEALRLRPNYAEAWNNVAAGYQSLLMWDEAIRAAQEALRIKPDFQLARNNLAYSQRQNQQQKELRQRAAAPSDPIAAAQEKAQQSPSPESFLDLSLAYHRAGRYQDCITVAKAALHMRPQYAEAYNNIAAGYQSLGMWDEAIQAATEALRIKPDFQLARNNLAYSQARKSAASGGRPGK